MDAITFLHKEHVKIKNSLTVISKKSRSYASKRKMFNTLCQYLIRHEAMEHKLWYPHFKNNKKLKPEVKHLLSEEKHAAKEIKKLKPIKVQGEWEKKFVKFKKAVIHHAKEEESDLFPNVRQCLDKAELQAIGKKMRQFKNKHKK